MVCVINRNDGSCSRFVNGFNCIKSTVAKLALEGWSHDVSACKAEEAGGGGGEFLEDGLIVIE